MKTEEFGKALQALRSRKKVGLRELARMTGMSPASLIAIEKGASSPNLATLHKIFMSLNTTFAEFFADSDEKSQLPAFSSKDMRTAADKHREYRFLFPRRVDIKFEMIYETIAASEKESDWEVHDCDLGGTIVSGSARLEIEDKGQWDLKKGDSFYINAGCKHRLINTGKHPVKQITAMYPPRY